MNQPVRAGVATRSFCTFRAEQRLYGVDVLALREISTALAITPVSPAVPAVRGLANLRSRILLVLDLRPLLGMRPAPCTQDSRLIIFKPSVLEDTGLLVDSGGNIIAVPTDRIESTDKAASQAREAADEVTPNLVVAVCKLEKELMMVIDVNRLSGIVTKLLK